MNKHEQDYAIAVIGLVLEAHTPHLVQDFEELIKDLRKDSDKNDTGTATHQLLQPADHAKS
jgi:hypothetical protein